MHVYVQCSSLRTVQENCRIGVARSQPPLLRETADVKFLEPLSVPSAGCCNSSYSVVYRLPFVEGFRFFDITKVFPIRRAEIPPRPQQLYGVRPPFLEGADGRPALSDGKVCSGLKRRYRQGTCRGAKWPWRYVI